MTTPRPVASAPAVCEVGRRYWVPCVRWELADLERWWPVYGERHGDPGLAPWQHLHIDPRFVTDHTFAALEARYGYGKRYKGSTCYSAIAHDIHVAFTVDERVERPVPDPVMRRMLCRRPWPRHPLQLLRHETTKPLPACGTCPHRQMVVPPEGAGVADLGFRTCPGHGLTWTAEGQPVERIGAELGRTR